MRIDSEYLREQYGSLSDEALLAIDRSDLVEAAQACYDAELERRQLGRARKAPQPEDPAIERAEDTNAGAEPDWLEEAAEVYSHAVRSGEPPAEDLTDAHDALEAAGVPCYMELVETQE